MAYYNNIARILVALLAIYLYFGGRWSIALVVFGSYAIFYNEQQNKIAPAENSPSVEEPKKAKGHACKCGNGGGCGSKKSSEKPKDGCCSSGGKKAGGCCSSKKQNEEKKKSTGEIEIDDFTIDFTESFKTNEVKKNLPKFNKAPKVFTKNKVDKKQEDNIDSKSVSDEDGLIKSAFTVSHEKLLKSNIFIFYSSLQGAAHQAATLVNKQLVNLKELENEPTLINLDELDEMDDYFIDIPMEDSLYILVIPSYDVDCPLDYFLQTMEENYNDFRVDRYPLRKLVGYSVLGLGDSESWPDKFCYQAGEVDKWMAKLGGRRIYPVGKICMKIGGNSDIENWASLLGETLKDDEPILYEYDESVSDENNDDGIDAAEDDGNSDSDGVVDVEDLAGAVKGTNKDHINSYETKQMVAKNSPTYKNLTKQGYKVIGSHSGVKVCRWTKNELRGRGSCYKKSLFNIASSRCMELTPSLACSSKCVFCWRHGTNPVSKNWRWETDSPEFILENALAAHYSMIKQMRGVPGVIQERFANAFKVGHCALSLVGEPILYPHISKFIELLHEKEITSFLVCNAQHPDSLRNIGHVTQLYVSIDAPTKHELKKVDRPLYKDYWERMLECLEILKTVQSHQRTVFRLTLVKGFNMGDISAYADLVERGEPCFIEVKGATFSGSSKDNVNSLTMQNIPYNEECKTFVESFVEELQRRSLNYELAAEHAHSNCILIANAKFKIDGEWYTHINFDKFFELYNKGEHFDYMGYIDKTPEWALYGNGGFAPGNVREIRKDKKLKNKLLREQAAKEEAMMNGEAARKEEA